MFDAALPTLYYLNRAPAAALPAGLKVSRRQQSQCVLHVLGQDAYEMVTEEDAAFTTPKQVQHFVHDQRWPLVS